MGVGAEQLLPKKNLPSKKFVFLSWEVIVIVRELSHTPSILIASASVIFVSLDRRVLTAWPLLK